MKPSILLLLPLLFLTACRVLEDGGDARADRIPRGTLLDLHQDLTVPPNQAGVFIQGTRIGNRFRFDAVCRLEVRTVDATFRSVVADQFTVVRVVREWERFSQQESGLRRVSLFGRDGPGLLRFSTVLHLHSDRQPDVLRLVCNHLQDSARQPRHLTTEEIRTVLTPVMTLHRPPGP